MLKLAINSSLEEIVEAVAEEAMVEAFFYHEIGI